MTEQLSLNPVSKISRRTTTSGRSSRVSVARAAGRRTIKSRSVDHRLDDHTREIGRQGVAAARAALADANRRVSARAALAEAQREDELIRRTRTASDESNHTHRAA